MSQVTLRQEAMFQLLQQIATSVGWFGMEKPTEDKLLDTVGSIHKILCETVIADPIPTKAGTIPYLPATLNVWTVAVSETK